LLRIEAARISRSGPHFVGLPPGLRLARPAASHIDLASAWRMLRRGSCLKGIGQPKGDPHLSKRAPSQDRDAEMSDNDKRKGADGPAIGVVVKPRPKTRKPTMYKVLMLNDDYTPMEFVVHVLERFFQKSREQATQIMLHVHRRGVGVCGVYTYEVAETKVTQVMDLARQNQHPLQCTIEKE
jgi:ATP-dependent Clp protease adaptor protein ClpS